MCNTFPTKVSCNVQSVSPSGSEDKKNGLCILAQNIINEKVFLALYAWYFIMFIVASVLIFYRTVTLILPQVPKSCTH